MRYYPVFLRVAGRRCVVIGGGSVAEQKVRSLIKAGARVTVVSPKITANLHTLSAGHTITCRQRAYKREDLAGCVLAIAATNDEEIQRRVVRDAAAARVWLNVVDRPEHCDFIVPAVVEQGDLVIATSTGGASPALAKRIRHDLQQRFGPEYADALRLLRRLRRRLNGRVEDPAERRRIFSALANSPLLDYLRGRQTGAIDRLLAETVGGEVSLAALGMELT